MSATNSESRPQSDVLTVDRPAGTPVVVEHEPSGQRKDARTDRAGVVRSTEDDEPLDAETHAVERVRSPYNRDGDWHYWERDADGVPVPPESDDPLDEVEIEGTDKWAFLAHGMLKEHAPLYDPIAMNERGDDVELTDAYAFPPTQDDVEGDLPYEPRPYRVNEESGDIPTGPIIGNRPAEEFLVDVYAVLEGAVRPADGISYETAYEIYDRAEALKADGGPHDQTIMAKVARWIRNPRLLDADESAATDAGSASD